MVLSRCEQCLEPLEHGCGKASCLTPEDDMKMIWTGQAVDKGWTQPMPPELPENMRKVLKWIASTSPKERMQFRETVVSSLERADAKQRWSGLLDQWYAAVDPEIRMVHSRVVSGMFFMVSSCCQVSGQVNGLLLAQLVEVVGHCDASCVEFLRHGKLVGASYSALRSVS